MKTAIYARVSTTDQSADMQLRELRAYCEARKLHIMGEYVDAGVSGAKERRPQLDRLMDDARKRKFDAVLVWKFDRFARSSRHLVNALFEFKQMGVQFISYTENVDTTSPMGQAIFTIIGAMAELERSLIRERVKAGVANAKAKGKRLGRPTSEYDPSKIAALRATGASTRAIAKVLGISNATVSRVLQNPASGV